MSDMLIISKVYVMKAVKIFYHYNFIYLIIIPLIISNTCAWMLSQIKGKKIVKRHVLKSSYFYKTANHRMRFNVSVQGRCGLASHKVTELISLSLMSVKILWLISDHVLILRRLS